MFHSPRHSSFFMFWIAMSTKIWSLIIVSVKTPPTGIYRAKQSSVFKRLPYLPGSWHMIGCAIFVITGQFCAGWRTYYFTSSRSQNRIMTCYKWPRNHCAAGRIQADLLRARPWGGGGGRTTSREYSHPIALELRFKKQAYCSPWNKAVDNQR